MERQNLDILPGGVLPVIHCSQGDIGREFQINLFSDNAPYVLDGTEELTIDGHKEDNNIFSYSIPATTGSTITISTQEQMTACAGNTICEIRIYKGDNRIGTCNFILQVEEGVSNGTPSESTLQALDEIRAEVQQAVEDAQTAQHNAETAETNAETAETNAINAKNQSESARDLSQTYATNSSNSATDSKNWAVGPSGSGSGTDTNNAKYYSQLASQSEQNASTSETNASNSASSAYTSEVNAGNSASAAHTSEVNASNSAGDANTAKLGAEAAQQKIENMTASASQLPEGSTPTVTKSEVGGVVNLAFGIPKGDTGATGQNGVSPEVAIGTISGGHSVTITDATHPTGQTFNVMDGLGVPSGGTTGQILAKASNADNDTEWITPSGGGGSTNINEHKALNDNDITVYVSGDYNTITYGKYLWTDGEDIYYYPTGQDAYKIVSFVNNNDSTLTITLETITKTDIGLPNRPNDTTGDAIWYNPLDNNIYFKDNRVWDKSTKTWTTVSSRYTSIYDFDGKYVWTDGKNVFYSNGATPTTNYRLSYNSYTYSATTVSFSGAPNIVDAKYFWTDGINTYYSNGTNDYIVDGTGLTFTSITWEDEYSNIINPIGNNIWLNGDDVYYDGGNAWTHYKLNKDTNKWKSFSRYDSSILGEDIFFAPDGYYYWIVDWSPMNWQQLQYRYNTKVKPM